ncbi:dnaJ protein ERDJ2A-like isoform X1 [Spinacia oleracea]|uniref:DnaJ protein ERDJ2A-like isoform X1 n=1 Tax=Spinacia oleracea TaxID=3562 RepID=A0ABM3RW67_SPIOL|nr:dnaJ protein ERDJ2A-like isoform X1 [Spinacia oleracea]XP_056699872.1 dnaJ protein ERDJ2A-like isoform X1 [Spinacia oleracea]
MVLSVIQTQLLIQAHLTRETADLPPTLNGDLKRVLELAHHLLEELMKMALIPRTAQGHGWLRPAIGVVELSQCVIQVFGVVFSCTSAASCCCRVLVVLLMCAGCSAGSPGAAVRSTGSVVFDCCCVQSYVAYPFIAFVVFGC